MTLLGQKKEMSYRYDDRGRRIPVTAVWVEPNQVLVLRTQEKEGYTAIQLGIGKKKHPKKPILVQLRKLFKQDKDQEITVPHVIAEARIDANTLLNPGDRIQPHTIFHKGLLVKVTGTSKGRGFAGGVKRWGFAGGPRTHGQSDRQRAPGSIGQTTTPGRVYKGKHMAGHMGNAQVSIKGLEVVDVDREQNIVYVKGAIPGFSGGYVRLSITGKVKAYQPPPEEKPEEETTSIESSEGQEKQEKPEVKGEEQNAS